jgi:DNA polymerase-1
LIKADYSQIELRIAAKVSGDQRMLAAYREGEDLHTLTARGITGRQEVTKEERQLAKAINFGLLYGMGAQALLSHARSNYGISLSLPDAQRYRGRFFDTYAALAAWHHQEGNAATPETRTLAGRRRLMVGDHLYTIRLNSPVQGTGADGLKRALALLWERREQCAGAVPVIACHDEIVVECDAEQAEAATLWLKQAMVDGMEALIRPVPVEVEVQVGRTWAG